MAATPSTDRVSVLLMKGVVGTGLWVVALCLVAALLSGFGRWTPWLGLPLAVVCLIGAVLVVPRAIPDLPHPNADDGHPHHQRHDHHHQRHDHPDHQHHHHQRHDHNQHQSQHEPQPRPHGDGRADGDPRHTPGWRGWSQAAPALALVAIVLAFGVWAGATHAEQVLPRRDSASNFQAALSLAKNHERVVAIEPGTVGLPEGIPEAMPGLTLASPAFYAVGPTHEPAIQPQFVIGPAAVYGLGEWLGGPEVIFWLPALMGALALLALGLLVSRFIGSWWAVLATALTGLSFPILHVSRSTYSEPLALLTLLAGVLALVLAVDTDATDATDATEDAHQRGASTRWALLAGVLIGGTTFVRIDGLREAILLLVVAGLGLAQGRRWPRSLLLGAGVSTLASFGAALWLSNQYLGSIAASLLPLAAIGVAVALLTGAGLWLRRRGWSLPSRYAVRVPIALAATTAVVLLAFATRPWWQTVRQDPNDPGARYVAGMQTRQGLAVDGGRTYAEQTVPWLSWWVGPVTLILAGAALVVLVHRATRAWTRGQALPSWTAPLLIGVGSTLMTLWRPGITPDHPWAERRLVIAIPLVIVLAVVALRWLWRGPGPSSEDNTLTQPHGIRHVLLTRVSVRRGVAALAGLGVLVPTALATAPLATARVELGELAAVEKVCAALQPDDVVLMVDSRAGNEWVQVVRGQCGVAALNTTAALRSDPARLSETIASLDTHTHLNIRRLVLLSAEDQPPAGQLAPGLTWRTITDVIVHESEHALEHRPDRLDLLPITVRLATLTR